MDKAFQAAADDLKDAQGKIAMVVVSDGEDMGSAPLQAAKDLGAQYSDRLCVYTVLVGDNEDGRCSPTSAALPAAARQLQRTVLPPARRWAISSPPFCSKKQCRL
jgi:hypothetical protein